MNTSNIYPTDFLKKMNNQNTPLVTVVTVTYNSAKYVRMAIESVLASSYTNFELIISDDCSTDNTWEIINEYKDVRIRAYRNEKNMGEYPNRNRCIDLAKGEYLIFIDGDDVIYAFGLRYLIDMFSYYNSAGILFSSSYYSRIIYPAILSPKEIYSFEYFDRGFTSIGLASIVFKTGVLREMGKFRTDLISGDSFATLNICSKYSALLIQSGQSWSRETPGQASERLSNPSVALPLGFYIKLYFLDPNICPLEPEIRQKADTKINRLLLVQIIKNTIKLNFGLVIKLFCMCNFKAILNFKSTAYKVLPEYNQINPIRFDFTDNPHANNNNNNNRNSSIQSS